MCLSGHRRYPFGSHDPAIRDEARRVMEKAIQLAVDCGIRTIQLAGYDVYYEAQDDGTIERFTEGMQWATALAASNGVMLAVEIMDTAFMNSISRWKKWDELVASPWFTVYPDVGNLSAWGNDVPAELALGIDRIAAIHLKDTYPVTATSKGQFRDVPFGDGCVDFVQVFQTLARLNYRGAFLIEMWTEKAAEPVAEIIHARADASKSMMGLTHTAGDEVRKKDITVAKNYLNETEISNLNRIVTMWLDFAEDQEKRKKQIFLCDWQEKLEQFLTFNDREVLQGAGNISKKQVDEEDFYKQKSRRIGQNGG